LHQVGTSLLTYLKIYRLGALEGAERA